MSKNAIIDITLRIPAPTDRSAYIQVLTCKSVSRCDVTTI